MPGLVLMGLLGTPGVVGAQVETPELRPATDARPYDRRAEELAQAYDRWRATRHPAPESYEVLVGLSWFPGVSAERSGATGLARIDLLTGSVAVELEGIDIDGLADVWLIDHRSAAGASAMPDPTDVTRLVGSLQVTGGYGTLNETLDPASFRDFDVDQVVVARRGEGPVEGGVLYGSLPLFERLYRASRRNGQGTAPIAGIESSRQGIFGDFPPPAGAAAGSPAALRAFEALIETGEDDFMLETFDGNGRTCATCHPPSNNFTLDKTFIAALKPDNPLFVAEFTPELDKELNGGLVFENPTLMREFALIVVNPDGFEDLASKFVMRSINHLFALALSTEPAVTPCTPTPPDHRLGWAGDGSHGSGTLREFAIGAVIQHAPRTMGRVEGVDFRLPTEEELDALEAFQLTLGRRFDASLASETFLDPNVAAGRDLFIGGNAKCALCHANGGALRRGPVVDKNFNFDIGIFNLSHPAESLGEPMPYDNGFGGEEIPPSCANSFSTPSIIEAADTPPYSHNNIFATLEEAIAHYSTPAFNEQSSAGRNLNDVIDLTDLEVNQLGALLRVLNALQNIEDVTRCTERARELTDLAESSRLLTLCMQDNIDAKEVLEMSPLGPLHPIALAHLDASLHLHRRAGRAATVSKRNSMLSAALAKLDEARREMVATPVSGQR